MKTAPVSVMIIYYIIRSLMMMQNNVSNNLPLPAGRSIELFIILFDQRYIQFIHKMCDGFMKSPSLDK